MADLARLGTIRAAARKRTPPDLARAAARALAAIPKRPRPPAALAYEEALRGAKKPGRFPVTDKDNR